MRSSGKSARRQQNDSKKYPRDLKRMYDSQLPLPPWWRTEMPLDDTGALLSIERYMDSLRAAGWTLIGREGGFARVFERDGCVIKVVRKDPAYLSYVRHILGAPTNRALPRIHDVVEIIGDGERFHHIVLERLEDFAPHLKRGAVTFEEIRALVYRIAVAEAAAPGSSVLTETDLRTRAAMTVDEQEALADIIRIAQREGLDTDFEPANVMLRGNELVFSDPLVISAGELGFPKADGSTRRGIVHRSTNDVGSDML
jgi:hypothetical protein